MMHFGYMFVLFVAGVNASSWHRQSKNFPYSQREGLRDIQNILRNSEIQRVIGERNSSHVKLSSDVVSEKTGCSCEKYNCGCCVHIDVKKIHLDSDVCVNLAYLPAEFGISVSLTIGGKIIFQEKISAKNPPPICVGVPELKKFASICIEFHDMNVSKTAFSGCVKLEARLIKIKVASVEIGCFNIPLKSQEQGRQPNWNSHFDQQGRESIDIQ